MVTTMDIFLAIEREDMIEAHRLMRERKQRKIDILVEMDALTPKLVNQDGPGHSRDIMERAFELLSRGQAREAKAILEERMTPEQLKFGNLLMEYLGFDPGADTMSTVDLSETQAMINEAFKQNL